MHDFEAQGYQYVGAVGHLISALMQTAGLFAQGAIIEYLSALIESMGALMYTFAIISALVSIAILGSYRQAMYLIIGPALFYFCLKTTVPAAGTQFRFGGYTQTDSVYDQRAFLQYLRKIDGVEEPLGYPQVSVVFVVFDQLVTQVVQNVASLFMSEEFQGDLQTVARERIYSNINTWQADNPGFIKLLSRGMVTECAEAGNLGRELASSTYEDPAMADTKTAKIALRDNLQQRKTVILYNDSDIVSYVENTFMSDASSGSGVVSRPPVDISVPVSCQEVWDLVYECARKEAERFEAGVQNRSVNDDPKYRKIDWPTVWKQVESSITNPSNSQDATALLAAILIQNTAKYTQHGGIIDSFYEHGQFNQARYDGSYHYLAKAVAKGLEMKLIYFLSAIPYVQGLFLYLLAMLFPFFCLFLLLPGKINSFFSWMSLWIWVKSWDVGFAFVETVRSLLQQWMAKDLVRSASAIDWTDPQSNTVEQLMSAYDPSATQVAYLSIITMMTVSVPILTAHVCAGANHLMRFVNVSVDKTAGRFQTLHENASRRDLATKLEMEEYALKASNGIRAAGNAERNPGSFSRLKENGNGMETVNRSALGDATHGAHIQASAVRAEYSARYSSRYRDLRGMLSSISGRPMTFSHTGTKYDADLGAFQNQFTEQMLGHEPGMGFATGSQRNRRDADALAPIPDPPKATKSEDGDGGED